MKLTPQREAELLNELRLRTLFSNKALCRRYGVSRRTLVRIQSKALDPFGEGVYQSLKQKMAQITPDTLHLICFTANGPQKRVKE
jgi:hypothetical protein